MNRTGNERSSAYYINGIKKAFTILSVVGITLSCGKSNIDESSMVDDGFFQCKVNGELLKISNRNTQNLEKANVTKTLLPSNSQTGYFFWGQKDSSTTLGFVIPTDTLKVQTYICDSTTSLLHSISNFISFNRRPAFLFFASDFLQINISSHKNGLISGTFSGKLSAWHRFGLYDSSNISRVSITEGEFKNLRCSY